MKKIIYVMILLLALCGCSHKNEEERKEIGITKVKEEEKHQIKATINHETVIITLYDNASANALWDMLPLTLEFEDFNHSEKIAYPYQTIPVFEDDKGMEPKRGEVAIYVPWGNIACFYQDGRYSKDLVPLGYMRTNIDILEKQSLDFTAYLER